MTPGQAGGRLITDFSQLDQGTTLTTDSLVVEVNPGFPIPQAATAVHGLRDADVAARPPFADDTGSRTGEGRAPARAPVPAPFPFLSHSPGASRHVCRGSTPRIQRRSRSSTKCAQRRAPLVTGNLRLAIAYVRVNGLLLRAIWHYVKSMVAPDGRGAPRSRIRSAWARRAFPRAQIPPSRARAGRVAPLALSGAVVTLVDAGLTGGSRRPALHLLRDRADPANACAPCPPAGAPRPEGPCPGSA